MKIKKGDTVLIISGKDRGRKGKVLEAFPKESRILIEGMNLRKKHQRPKKSGEKGQIVEMPGPMDVSNVKLVCPGCGKATRVGYKSKIELPKEAKAKKRTNSSSPTKLSSQKSKIRICKKCRKEV
jgi:large subunit ribosomal protein L24